MIKQLYLMRHAKSSWDDATLPDRERPLNRRGRRNAPEMGRALAERMAPMEIQASPALRAQLTLGGLQDGWPGLRELQHSTEEALYTFSAGDLVDWMRSREDEREALFLIGHNPGLTDLVNWLCGDPVLANLPTAGFVQLSLAIPSWSALEQGCGELVQRLFPRELEAGKRKE